VTQLKKISSQSAEKTKIWRVKQGDTLWFIAAREYANPALWRRIAVRNKIYNPHFLEPGRVLIIPPLE